MGWREGGKRNDKSERKGENWAGGKEGKGMIRARGKVQTGQEGRGDVA